MRNGFLDFSFIDISGTVEYPDSTNKASATFKYGSKRKIRLKIPREFGVTDLCLTVYDESCRESILSLNSVWIGLYEGVDVYEAALDTNALGLGLYFYNLELKCANGQLYGYKNENKVLFASDKNIGELFQITVYDFLYDKPTGEGGVIYHIFVDRFNRGGESEVKPGALLPSDWSAIPEFPLYPGAPLQNNSFFGGTLDGITEKLDYIASLGADAIYLSPIFESPSNHKYDTADYMTVDKMLGGEKALTRLIFESKKRNIEIILDGVFNHTGADSIYFNRYGHYASLGAYQSKASRFYPWFDFSEHPNSYTCWWNIEILPRINTEIFDCRDYFIGNGGVIEKYADLGIRGFRLDVADELSDNFISEIKAKLNEKNKSSVLYGEVWEDGSNKIAYGKRKKYFLGSELDGVMNYPIRTGIINYLNSKNTSLLFYALYDIINNAPKRIRDMQMNILGSHDTERILTVLAGKRCDGYDNATLAFLRLTDSERAIAKRKLIQAYTVLATIPGIPVIFYGDEAGLEGYGDPFNRMPYPWGYEDMELLSFYRLIGKIRRQHDVYKSGGYEFLYLTGDHLFFKRYDKNFSYITIVNNSDKIMEISPTDEYFDLLSDRYKNDMLRINPRGVGLIKIKTDKFIIF